SSASPPCRKCDARARLAGTQVRMRDGDRQCVGRVGLQRIAHVQQDSDHVLHLFLASMALADHGLLDGVGRVLADRQSAPDRRADRGAARLPELQCGIGIFRHEHAFDRRLGRRLCLDDGGEFVIDAFKPQRERLLARHLQRRAEHAMQLPRGIGLDDTYASALAAGIDAEDAQRPRGMHDQPAGRSALECTACTSSSSSSRASRPCTASTWSAATGTSSSARIVTSAWSGFSPVLSIASRTASNESGVVITSIWPSSGHTFTSSAPASMAASVIFSSSAPPAYDSTPIRLNKYATEPSVPRLPPNLVKAWRTSEMARWRLSVTHSTSTATPPGA